MTTDTSTQPKGDIHAQQVYFLDDAGRRINLASLGSEIPLFHHPFTSVKGRLEYLKSLPHRFEGSSLEHNFGTPEENQRQYLARKRADQETYTSQMRAVKQALEWVA